MPHNTLRQLLCEYLLLCLLLPDILLFHKKPVNECRNHLMRFYAVFVQDIHEASVIHGLLVCVAVKQVRIIYIKWIGYKTFLNIFPNHAD